MRLFRDVSLAFLFGLFVGYFTHAEPPMAGFFDHDTFNIEA